ncbi:MAG: polyprenyl synthetase family protein [Chloracidobacterium sp.]|nr:polyprenyl synthetase family protein [Chloracidobacterium sp.]
MQQFAPAKKNPSLSFKAAKIFELISNELVLVENEFDRQASSNIQVINYLGEYLRASGGKRIRPALLILSNYAAGGKGSDDNVIRLATVMEMLHTATLVHDDIIDNADMRRNRSSVNARFGNQTAVLMGDWLYMSAFETTVRERSLEIIDILTRLTRKMTEGELIQLTTIGRLDISEAEYFDILQRKTAFLFSACCEVGAILSGADTSIQAAMRDYGINLGIAFQIADDILDVTSDADQLGKAAGSDLLEGKLTLPLISLIRKEPSLLPAFEKIMLFGEYAKFSRDDLKKKLAEHSILEAIRDQAKAYVSSARKSIDVLPKTEYRSSLEDILDFIIDRSS